MFFADGRIVLNVIVLDITEQAKNEELLLQASETARIGSWEMNLVNQKTDDIYWSPIKEILELEESLHLTYASTWSCMLRVKLLLKCNGCSN
jgi:hypothetical protein